jgi:hypothetical protein
MDAIIVRCKMCKHEMKFSAAKAGKRAKCSKCDAINLIPTNGEAKQEEAPAPAAADPFADDGPANYGVVTDPELEERRKQREAEEAAAKKKRKKRDKLPSVARKIKAIPDKEAWQKVRIGCFLIFIGVWIWLACHFLQGWYVLIGSVELPEFANMMARDLKNVGERPMPEIGHRWDISDLRLYLGMIAGRDFLNLAWTSLIISSVLYFIQAFLWAVGYGFCLPVPRRFGMFGQLLLLLMLVVLNIILMFFFRFLAVVVPSWYVMIPLITPEIAMTEYNMERMVPINVMFAGASWGAFFENVGCLIIKALLYLEPTIMSVFIWSAGVAIKDDGIASSGRGRVEMSLGTLFIIICYHLLSLCGASPVLVIVLRVIYALWFFFLIIFMLQYAMLLLKFRAVLYDKINPKFELEDDRKEEEEDEDDEEDEDEEDEDDEPRKKKKRK